MKNKKRNRILGLLILLLTITVGYAVLTGKLDINGISHIHASSWNIHWDNVDNEAGEIAETAAYIKDPAKTEVEFGVRLPEPGTYYEFTVDAVNEGSMDGYINKIETKANGRGVSFLPSYITYSVKYADGTEPQINDLLAKKSGNTPTRKTYKVRVEFTTDITQEQLNNMDGDQEYTFNFSVVYGQKQKQPIDIDRKVPGKVTPGDELCIKSECFYVVHTNDNTTTLIAKYNLLVGYDNIDLYNPLSSTHTLIPTDTPGYGLQSPDTIETYDGTTRRKIGTYPFYDNNRSYWQENVGSGKQFNQYIDANGQLQTFTGTVEDSGSWETYSAPYVHVYNQNSSIYPFINSYVETLKEMANYQNITGRILSYNEADAAKNVMNKDSKSIIFDGTKSFYWLDSAKSAMSAWIVYEGESYSTDDHAGIYFTGIRPAIEVPTSLLK